MDMDEFEMLTTYWQDHPPPHLMIAGYLSIKPKQKADHPDLVGALSQIGFRSKALH